jgi:hypothetical protein
LPQVHLWLHYREHPDEVLVRESVDGLCHPADQFHEGQPSTLYVNVVPTTVIGTGSARSFRPIIRIF